MTTNKPLLLLLLHMFFNLSELLNQFVCFSCLGEQVGSQLVDLGTDILLLLLQDVAPLHV